MRKYDETSSVVQCRWDHGEHLLGPGEQLVDMETGPTKIFVTELKIGMLFEKKTAAHSEWMSIVATCPSTLQAVERNTAECYVEALRRAMKFGFDATVQEKFAREVDIVVSDGHKSNGKAERALSQLYPGRAKLDLPCDVHRKASIATKTFALWKSLPTRVIRLALSVRGACMTVMRRHLRDVMKERLKIYSGTAPPAATAFRKEMLDLYLPANSPSSKWRRCVVDVLFNGDWRVADEIQYYDVGQISGGRKAIERCF